MQDKIMTPEEFTRVHPAKLIRQVTAKQVRGVARRLEEELKSAAMLPASRKLRSENDYQRRHAIESLRWRKVLASMNKTAAGRMA